MNNMEVFGPHEITPNRLEQLIPHIHARLAELNPEYDREAEIQSDGTAVFFIDGFPEIAMNQVMPEIQNLVGSDFTVGIGSRVDESTKKTVVAVTITNALEE